MLKIESYICFVCYKIGVQRLSRLIAVHNLAQGEFHRVANATIYWHLQSLGGRRRSLGGSTSRRRGAARCQFPR